jgi:hypothetical protein
LKHYFDTGPIIIGDGWASDSYSTIEIFAALGRNAKDLYVINEGPDKMFVKTYTDYKLSRKLLPTEERWIYPGETRCFHDVYRILIAKTSIGNQYHITEFKPTTIALIKCWFCGSEGMYDIEKICNWNHPRLNAKAYDGALVGVDENTELRMTLVNRHELGIYLAVHWTGNDKKQYGMEFPLSIMGCGWH